MTKKQNNPHLTGAFDLFSKSVDVVKSNLQTFLILWILPFLGALSNSANYRLDGREKDFANGINLGGIGGWPTYSIAGLVVFGLIFFVFFFILSLIIQTMTITLQLEASKGKNPSLRNLWEVGLKYWLRLLGLFIVVGLAVLGGLILFIVPGLIMIRRYFLSPYVMIDQNTGIMDSMRKSAELSKPYSGYIWSIIGVIILLSLFNVVPIFGPIIAFGLVSIYSVAPALRYLELKKIS